MPKKTPTIHELLRLHPEIPEMQSINDWCEGRCTRSHFYRLKDPPETIDLGGKRMITRLGHLEWLRRQIMATRAKAA